MCPGFELPGNIGVPDNGTGNELRKKRHIGCKVDGVLLCRNVTAIHIHSIAEDLERIKADADGQRDPKQRNRQACYRVAVSNKEINVFEIPKHDKAAGNRQDKQKLSNTRLLSETLDQNAKAVSHYDGKQHPDHIPRLSPPIEKQARQKQYSILESPRYNEIQEEHAGQEIK